MSNQATTDQRRSAGLARFLLGTPFCIHATPFIMTLPHAYVHSRHEPPFPIHVHHIPVMDWVHECYNDEHEGVQHPCLWPINMSLCWVCGWSAYQDLLCEQ